MRLALAIATLVAVMLVGLLLFGDRIDAWLGSEAGVDWLRAQGPWAGLAGVMLIVADLVLPIPVTGVIAGLGQVYGPVVGGLYALVGCLAGGLVAYFGARALGPRAARFIAGAESLDKLEHFFQTAGPYAIALTRMLPVVPEALSCLAGLARMPLNRYLLALTVGSVPIAFVFAAFGSTAGDEPLANVLIATLAPVVIFPPVWILLQRHARSATRSAPNATDPNEPATLDDSPTR